MLSCNIFKRQTKDFFYIFTVLAKFIIYFSEQKKIKNLINNLNC